MTDKVFMVLSDLIILVYVKIVEIVLYKHQHKQLCYENTQEHN